MHTTVIPLVRPALTLLFAGTVIFLALTGRVSVDFIQGLAAGIINFWFAKETPLWGRARDQDLA